MTALPDPLPGTRPFATLALLLICGWIFIWLQLLGDQGAERARFAFGLIPAVLNGHLARPAELNVLAPPWTLFSALFIHSNGVLLGINLCYLWFFGSALESALRRGYLVALFCIGGGFAGLVTCAGHPALATPLTGASGSISALLGAYCLVQPQGVIEIRIPRRPHHALALPALPLCALWFVAQLGVAVAWPDHGVVLPWYAHALALLAGGACLLFMKRHSVALFARRP